MSEFHSNADDGINSPSAPVIFSVCALAAAFAVFPTVGQWPTGYYDVARWIASAVGLLLAYWTFQHRHYRWLIFTILGVVLFNPILPFLNDSSWDIWGLVYAVGFALFSIEYATPRVAAIFAGIFGTCAAIVLTLTWHVNHNMPHGPRYESGEVVCMNDGRGPCGEETVEDMSALDIPDWAKFLRKNLIWSFIFLVGGTVLSFTKSQETE